MLPSTRNKAPSLRKRLSPTNTASMTSTTSANKAKMRKRTAMMSSMGCWRTLTQRTEFNECSETTTQVWLLLPSNPSMSKSTVPLNFRIAKTWWIPLNCSTLSRQIPHPPSKKRGLPSRITQLLTPSNHISLTDERLQPCLTGYKLFIWNNKTRNQIRSQGSPVPSLNKTHYWKRLTQRKPRTFLTRRINPKQ